MAVPLRLSVSAVPFGRVAVARADAPLRDEPLRDVVARFAVAPLCERFAPFREAVPLAERVVFGLAFVVLALDAFAVAARPLVRALAEPVPDAGFDADAVRERVAVLLRVPPLDRFVVAIVSSKVCRQGVRHYPRDGGSNPWASG
jgi:hypothetical protein